MIHDRPDCTHEFSCGDGARLITVPRTLFSKRDTSGSPHPACPDPILPAPSVHSAPSRAGTTVHLTEVFQKTNPANIISHSFTEQFFDLSSLLEVADQLHNDASTTKGTSQGRRGAAALLSSALVGLPLAAQSAPTQSQRAMF